MTSSTTSSTGILPDAFRDLEPYAADWALPTRQERYDMRLSKTIDELLAFYDATAPRAEEAIAYLTQFSLDELPADATRLLHLMYSMRLVASPVTVFLRPRIHDSGAAFSGTAFSSTVAPRV